MRCNYRCVTLAEEKERKVARTSRTDGRTRHTTDVAEVMMETDDIRSPQHCHLPHRTASHADLHLRMSMFFVGVEPPELPSKRKYPGQGSVSSLYAGLFNDSRK
ncbi:unnamed protein product [Nezara viridula]|uniref:Uncharacterized protein n=1 Tax=Nezara viridula TaxID=85310 RepID=A0A9P0HEL1_NEZVI|nr:unnamed protein product [Nezara viridula]